jgi:hypothetical protein
MFKTDICNCKICKYNNHITCTFEVQTKITGTKIFAGNPRSLAINLSFRMIFLQSITVKVISVVNQESGHQGIACKVL